MHTSGETYKSNFDTPCFNTHDGLALEQLMKSYEAKPYTGTLEQDHRGAKKNRQRQYRSQS